MVEWRADGGGTAHDLFSRAIFESLERQLSKYIEQDFKIDRIRTPGDECHEYRLVDLSVVLPGGIEMDVDCWCDVEAELGTDQIEGFDENVAEVTDIVMYFIQQCESHGFQNIAEEFKKARHYARSLCAQRPAEQASLFNIDDLRLSFTSYWRHTGEIIIDLEYRSLDAWLTPNSDHVQVFSLQEIQAEITDAYEPFAKRAAAKSRLQKSGATGEIDLLAINFLKQSGDLQSELKSLGEEAVYRKHELAADCGHVRLKAWLGDALELQIDGDIIRISGRELPEATRIAAIGRPLTSLVDFPLSSSDMTIVNASNRQGSVVLEIAQPRLYYCSNTGHSWPT